MVTDTDSTSNTSSHVLSICLFYLFGQGDNVEGVYDPTSSYGRECHLVAVSMVRITKGAMAGGYFATGLMACGTTGYLHCVLVTVNDIATANSIMNMLNRIGCWNPQGRVRT